MRNLECRREAPPWGLEFRIPHSTSPALHQAQCGARVQILLYTRFFEFKLERVLEVLRRVLEEIPDARLVVVGKGFNGEEDRLLERAEAMGCAARSSMPGGWTRRLCPITLRKQTWRLSL